jgi:hypothetical protein
MCWVPEVHTCNLRGWDWLDYSSRPAWANSSWDCYQKSSPWSQYQFMNNESRFLFFFFVELGFELRALSLQAGALAFESHVPFIFALVIFGDGISWTISLGWPQTTILPIWASQVARINRCEPPVSYKSRIFEEKEMRFIYQTKRRTGRANLSNLCRPTSDRKYSLFKGISGIQFEY